MRKLLYKILLFIGCIPLTNYGFVYEAKILINPNKNQQFIGLSDFHDKIHPVTKKQLMKIETWLAHCDKEQTKVLLEDLSSKGSAGRNSCGRFKVNSKGGILGGLTEYCESHNLFVENVEYRYCRVSALGPVLNDSYTCISQIPSVNNISVACLVKEIQDIIHEIQAYDDGKTLNAYYQKNVKEVEAELQKLSLDCTNGMSVGHYLTLYSHQKNRFEILKRLLTFDSSLLDLKLIHNVVNASQQKVVTIAGGSHISRVADALVKHAGYKKEYSTPVQYDREHDVKKCLGSAIIDDNFCLRPQPIDLGLLDRYMAE